MKMEFTPEECQALVFQELTEIMDQDEISISNNSTETYKTLLANQKKLSNMLMLLYYQIKVLQTKEK